MLPDQSVVDSFFTFSGSEIAAFKRVNSHALRAGEWIEYERHVDHWDNLPLRIPIVVKYCFHAHFVYITVMGHQVAEWRWDAGRWSPL